ncbi:MAG: hypothetical protein SGILL_002719 [Bacillariaceae sp.]
MGWEYKFQYLQAPKRRRIWLRSLQPIKIKEKKALPKEQQLSRQKLPSALFLSSPKTLLNRIRDDWNFKGYGMSIYKSFVFPESCGVGLRLPLTVNFDYFDSHPEWPSLTIGTGAFFPGTVMGYLSGSVHLDWVRWVLKSSLALVPRLVLWSVYKVILPILWALVTFALFPIRDRLPASSAILPDKIPQGFWNTISRPRYNPEISERVGCSASYRWSIQRGYEFRISYWHSYLPTLLVYQQLWARTQQRMRAIAKLSALFKRDFQGSGKINIGDENPIKTSAEASLKQRGWWQRHFARLGVSTGYPIPSPPHFSCSGVLSLSGLYLGNRNELIKSAVTDTMKAVPVSTATAILDEALENVKKEPVSLQEKPQVQNTTGLEDHDNRMSGKPLLSK